MAKYNIKQVAKITNLKPSTIRYYDSMKLLNNVERDENNYREFNDEHIQCLNVYKQLRDIDMSIIEIEYVHKKYTAGELTHLEIDAILDNQKSRINNEIKLLEEKLFKINVIKKVM